MSETVIVVGSGPCGATAATELVRRGVDVTLLEAGLRAPRGVLVRVRGNTVFRWVGEDMAHDRHVPAGGDPTTSWHSSLSLGGLSNFWTAAVPRFHPRDFDEGARLDERYRWPVTYDDVEPFYDIVERSMLVTGGDPIAGVPGSVYRFRRSLPSEWATVAAEAGRRGYPIGSLPMASGHPTMAARRPTGWNSWHCMLTKLTDRPNFHLVPGAQVLRVQWSGSAGGVTGVEYVDVRTGQRRHLAGRAVVLAAGALDSTRILLQSRSVDFPNGLGNDHGVLGRYLHDHPKQWWPVRFDRPLPLLASPAYLARADHDSSPPLLACSHTVGMVGMATRVKAWVGARDTLAGVQVFGTMIPREDHTVTVERHDDVVDEARAPLRLTTDYDDPTRQNMVDARERFIEAMAAGGVRATPQGPFADLRPGESVHYAGTARMHADPRYGVLDGWNRVHGVPNLTVVDMACFTTNPEKNPTLTAMALAARAAHRLADDVTAGDRF